MAGAASRAVNTAANGGSASEIVAAASDPKAMAIDAATGVVTGGMTTWARSGIPTVSRQTRNGTAAQAVGGSGDEITQTATEAGRARFVAGSDGVVTDLVGASPNAVVLGKYPAYVNQAGATGSRAFSMSDEAWNAMTPAEQWIRNQQFLDQAITRGSAIQLATAPTAKNLTGFYAKEIDYLVKQGYTISSDGTRMIPPGG